MKNKVTIENWEEVLYKTSHLLSFISIGAEYSESSPESIKVVYNVVTSDLEFNEKYQQSFSTLEEAIVHINATRLIWDISSKNGIEKEGCGSCSAH